MHTKLQVTGVSGKFKVVKVIGKPLNSKLVVRKS
jgi:hypothetical protein